MNEGWASHWHHRIMTSLDLPQEIFLEFMVRHNQVICPHPGGLNPYHVGFMVWRDIEHRFGGAETKEGRAKLFEVRESERDVSFLRRFLTEDLAASSTCSPGSRAASIWSSPRSPTASTGTTSRTRC